MIAGNSSINEKICLMSKAVDDGLAENRDKIENIRNNSLYSLRLDVETTMMGMQRQIDEMRQEFRKSLAKVGIKILSP